MAAGAIRTIARLIRPSSLTGPIFGKELRVSSRRRRYYALRTVYLALLILFIAGIWRSTVEGASDSAWSIARMEAAGRTIIVAVIWFQFAATQVVALVMLSTAISDEVHRRTLGVLMTTPISSFQIVMGKLLSRLLQLLMLLAISVPLLAMVRVFGGVPWQFLAAGLCITVTGMIFTGSVSLFFSITDRHAYVAIVRAAVVLLVLFLALPFIVINQFSDVGGLSLWVSAIFLYMNPTWSLIAAGKLLLPGAAAKGIPFYWQAHCLIMLGMSAAVLSVCVLMVRRAGLRQAAGEGGLLGRRRRNSSMAAAAAANPVTAPAPDRHGRIRRLTGSPVIWRELRTPIFRTRMQALVGVAAIMIVLALSYLACAEHLDEDISHIIYALILVIVGLLGTCVLAATPIASENEAGTLPILLSTTLGGWHIIAGKAVGVFRRSMGVWILLLGHVGVFVMAGYIHSIALVHLSLLVAWLVLFLTGTGLYFSSRFRRTTTAVVANITLAATLWLVLPIVMGLMSGPEPGGAATRGVIYNANPIVQTVVLIGGSSGAAHANMEVSELRYRWLDETSMMEERWPGAGAATGRMWGYLAAYGLAGLLFACLAKGRLRRRIF